jgi:hypothetical protein
MNNTIPKANLVLLSSRDPEIIITIARNPKTTGRIFKYMDIRR